MSKKNEIENPDLKSGQSEMPPPPPRPKGKPKLKRSESRSLASYGFYKGRPSTAILSPENHNRRRVLGHDEKPAEENKPGL